MSGPGHVPKELAERLAAGALADPFGVLGPHQGDAGPLLRTYQPGAVSVAAQVGAGAPAPMEEVAAGLFIGRLPGTGPYRLLVRWAEGEEEIEDPYRFGPVLGDLDIHLFREGAHLELGRRMGAQVVVMEGVPGVAFSLWAPNAACVSVIGDFNAWDHRRHPMRLRHDAGVFELFLPGVRPGERYKFAVLGADGVRREKADPLARATELPPATASVVAAPPDYPFEDADWLARRRKARHAERPLSVYEVHAASWLRPEGDPDGVLGWDELALRLPAYAADLGFTHIELLPIMEHPFGGSWGYQPLSQFAPSARFGPPEAFARFVDACHRQGIGVILDWVPAHFPTDAHGLAFFDGTALYEYADPREGFHQDWNSLIYNYGRREVQGFLIASALFWLERFHVDAIRVDAVASMLYRDYSRKAGEWIPNVFGGRENLEAVAFLRRLTTLVAERVPGAMVIAEESTAWPGVTRPPSEGGLGFTFKWNMGWMHDSLAYMQTDPLFRSHHHGQMTFGMVYAYSERFILPLSHDEVVYGKGSMLGKMPGDDWRRFANLRVFYAFMTAHPGKKLLFMGDEFGQSGEWSHDGEVSWGELEQEGPQGVQLLVRDLNRIYAAEAALHETDAEPQGFAWILADDAADSLLAFARFARRGAPPLLFVGNFTPVPRLGVRLGAPRGGAWRVILNTDAAIYGGGNVGPGERVWTEPAPAHGQPQSLVVTAPPLGGLFLRWEEEEA